MLLQPILRAHAFMKTAAPPELWEPVTEDRSFLPLLGEMISAALQSGYPLSDLTLAAANVVVAIDAEAEVTTSTPAPGEYVAVSVAGPGLWTTDWRWLPARDVPPQLPIPVARLVEAQACWAYGRALEPESSITVFLARHSTGGSG